MNFQIKLIFVLTVLMCLVSPDKGAAQINDIYRNPFIPQIPKPEIVIEKTKEPESVKQPESRPRVEAPIVRERPQVYEPVAEEPTTPVPPSFKLYGLVWNSNKPQAIINEQIVTKGELLDLVNPESSMTASCPCPGEKVMQWPSFKVQILNIDKSGVQIAFLDEVFDGLTLKVEP